MGGKGAVKRGIRLCRQEMKICMFIALWGITFRSPRDSFLMWVLQTSTSYVFIWKFLKTTIARRKMKSHFPNWTLDTHYVLLACWTSYGKLRFTSGPFLIYSREKGGRRSKCIEWEIIEVSIGGNWEALRGLEKLFHVNLMPWSRPICLVFQGSSTPTRNTSCATRTQLVQQATPTWNRTIDCRAWER